MKRWEISILIGLILSITTNSITSFAAQCSEVRQSTIRLHILANSDSEADQALKLLVRDAVLTQTADVFGGAQEKEQTIALAQSNIGRITTVAEKTLRENGCNDSVTVQVVNMFFETRQYGNVVMPAGQYDAVRILIGAGAGHNWWCVMFPPMCLPAAQGKPNPALTQEQNDMLIPAQPEYQIKFAVVEVYEKLREKLRLEEEEKEAAQSATQPAGKL